jgi:hypothetical protein
MDKATSLTSTYKFLANNNFETENKPIFTSKHMLVWAMCVIQILLCFMKIIVNANPYVYQDKRKVTEILIAELVNWRDIVKGAVSLGEQCEIFSDEDMTKSMVNFICYFIAFPNLILLMLSKFSLSIRFYLVQTMFNIYS